MKNKADRAAAAVLIAAPLGKDATLAAAVMEQSGIHARPCANLTEVAAQLGDETLAMLIAEEALVARELPLLLTALRNQPQWSDVPIIVLTSSGAGDRMSRDLVDVFGPAGNVTLLERPLGSVTLLSAVKVALRARTRQHEVRDLFEQRETVLTGISDAFAALDRQWRYTYVNEKAAEYAGLSREEMIGRCIWDIYPEAKGGNFYTYAYRAVETQQPQQFEQFYPRWNCWLETRIYPAGEGVSVFRANINERKEQEALVAEADRKLQENEALLRLAIEAADAGTFDYYPLTGLVHCSKRCQQLFNLSSDTPLTYETYLAAVHPDDREVFRATEAAAFERGKRERYDIEYRIVGGEPGEERWVAEKGRAIIDENGRVTRFIGTILDVTERKTAELALRRAKADAEEANRAKDRFLAMLSHELRTPLTPVLMTIASLRRQSDLSDELRSDLEVLQRNVELEALLIDDLLDLTRIQHGKLELHRDAVDVHTALDHALKICAAELKEKELQVTRQFRAKEYHAWADSARLQQVFWNLVKNAVKFTSRGGHIELRTRNHAAHALIVEVADTGIGIEPQLMPRIFDAFEQGGRTTTKQYGGLGLGLAISKRVVDLHGGTIAVESAGTGKGATFTVTLQAMGTSLLGTAPVYLPTEPASAAARILFVEDHQDTARVLRRVLEKAGYLVSHAGSVQAAKDLARAQSFDLLISDLGLPDGSGLELMRSLHEPYGLSGIALSGFGTEDDLAATAAAGFSEHLTKPVDWPQLRNAIERLLASRSSATAAIAAP